MADEVKVLNLWASPFGMRVLVALEAKGIPYTYQEEDLANKSELLLKSNPIHKKIPVLIHNGKPICESNIIVQYIDERWPGKSSLMPSDAYERAQARFWADFLDKKLYENAGALIVRGNKEQQEEGKRNMIEYLGYLEKTLGDKAYFGGDEFGFLDVAVIPFCPWFSAYETVGEWKIPFESDFPKFNAWMKKCSEREHVKKKKCSEREHVKKVMYTPDKVTDFCVGLRNRLFPK